MPVNAQRLVGAAKTRAALLWELFAKNTTTTHYLAPLSITGLGVSTTALTGSSFYTDCPTSLFILGAALDNTISLLIVGENQFGEAVSETLSLAAGTTSKQTLKCYQRVTKITITAAGGAFGADDTIAVGMSLVDLKLPLLAKLEAGGSVLAVKNINGVAPSTLTFTVSLDPNWNILLTGTASGSPIAAFYVYLNSEDSQL